MHIHILLDSEYAAGEGRFRRQVFDQEQVLARVQIRAVGKDDVAVLWTADVHGQDASIMVVCAVKEVVSWYPFLFSQCSINKSAKSY